MDPVLRDDIYEAFVQGEPEIEEQTKTSLREAMPNLTEKEEAWAKDLTREYRELLRAYLVEGSPLSRTWISTSSSSSASGTTTWAIVVVTPGDEIDRRDRPEYRQVGRRSHPHHSL